MRAPDVAAARNKRALQTRRTATSLLDMLLCSSWRYKDMVW